MECVYYIIRNKLTILTNQNMEELLKEVSNNDLLTLITQLKGIEHWNQSGLDITNAFIHTLERELSVR